MRTIVELKKEIEEDIEIGVKDLTMKHEAQLQTLKDVLKLIDEMDWGYAVESLNVREKLKQAIKGK